MICDSKDEEFIIKKSWDGARCLHMEDRHREQIYLYPPINKRSQVNHTFVLKLECSTRHVLKKARKFLQTGTAAGGAGSAWLPAWMRCCSKLAKGCEAPALLLLQGEKWEHAKAGGAAALSCRGFGHRAKAEQPGQRASHHKESQQ